MGGEGWGGGIDEGCYKNRRQKASDCLFCCLMISYFYFCASRFYPTSHGHSAEQIAEPRLERWFVISRNIHFSFTSMGFEILFSGRR